MDTQRSGQTLFDQLGLSKSAPKASPAGYSDRENLGRFALIALLVLVFLGPIMTFGSLSLSDQGSTERQIGYVVVFVLTIYAAFPTATRLSFVAMPWPVLLVLGWCWLSLIWSISPSDSFRRLVLTTTVTWTVFLVVRHAGYRSTIEIIRWCLVGAVILSYIVVFVDPQTGIHPMADSAAATASAGQWRGFLGHKNFAGAVCALCIVTFIFDASRFPVFLRLTVIALAGYFLFRTESKTSAGMLGLAVLGGIMFVNLGQRARAYLMPILTVMACIIWGLLNAYGDFLRTTFLNPKAFTGRGQIWTALLNYASDHRMLGSGYGSFWNIGGQSPIFSYGQGFVTEITVGHSGYIDQLAAVGLPGVLLMIFAAIIWPFLKLIGSQGLEPSKGALISSLLIFCIGHNVTESGLFERDAIVSVFLLFTIAFAQHAGDGKRRARSEDSGDELLRTMRRRQKAATAEAPA
ncbi:O-antigen ligase [soil metagenome]